MEAKPEMLFQRLVPLLQVSDVSETMLYFEEALGFHTDFTWPNAAAPKWAQVSRDGVSFGFTVDLGTSREPFLAEKGNGVVFYIMTPDVDGLYAELEERGAIIAQGVQSFGDRRQFSVGDPNGYLISFTESLSFSR